MEQRLRVFEQTSAQDIVSALKDALLLPPTQEILLLDSEGTIVVFSNGRDLPAGEFASSAFSANILPFPQVIACMSI